MQKDKVIIIKDNLEYISYPKYIDKNILSNKLNSIYPNMYISTSDKLFNNLDYVYKNLIDLSNYNILDIGCNIGTYSFLSYYNNAKYTEGIDFNCNYIQIANDTKKQLVINDDNIQFINDNVFNLDFTKKKFDVILYLNNIFFSHELNNTNLKLHILLCKLQKNTDYFILGDCFEETINYFNVILLKYKYYKKYTYKNIVIYEK